MSTNIELPKAPPYHLVLIPCVDQSPQAKIKSLELATSLSKKHSDINTFEVIDFEGDYLEFTGQPLFPDELKNLAHFIEVSERKFFIPGTITLVANFDDENISLIVENLKLYKPDLQILLLMTSGQFVKYGIFEEFDCVDISTHQGDVTKSMMQMLCMTGDSH